MGRGLRLRFGIVHVDYETQRRDRQGQRALVRAARSGPPSRRHAERDERGHQLATRPTLEEVAALAGVGRGTVVACRQRLAAGAPEARAAVQEAIAELGLRAQPAARALVTRRTDAVALVDRRVRGAGLRRAVLRRRGARHRLRPGRAALPAGAAAWRRPRRARSALENYLTRQHVDGVLLLSLHDDDPLPELLRAARAAGRARRPAR